MIAGNIAEDKAGGSGLGAGVFWRGCWGSSSGRKSRAARWRSDWRRRCAPKV